MADFRSERSNNPLRILAGVALLGAISFAATTKTPGKVTSVRFWSMGESTRIAIEVSCEFTYHQEKLTNPDRLFFDIRGARPEASPKSMQVIAVGDPLLKQMRVAETQPGVTRIVLDLMQPVEYTASQLSNPDRLMIEIRSKSPAPVSTSSSSGAKSLKDSPVRPVESDILAASTTPLDAVATAAPKFDAKVPEAKSPDARALAAKPEPRTFEPPPNRAAAPKPATPAELISQPVFNPYVRLPKDPLPPPNVQTGSAMLAMNTAPAARVGPSLPDTSKALPEPSTGSAGISREPLPAKNGARSLTRVLGLKLGRVVIDPGHGGHDAGTHGPSGLYEKDVVLDISLRLGKLLQDRLGSDVVYTRDTDVYIPLEERTHIANDHKADLFLSIHANSSPYRTAAGVETYYLNFTTSKTALDVAARENAGSQKSIFDLKEVLQKIALRDKIDESREFAGALQKSLYSVSSKGNSDAKNRGIKRAPFVVLIGAQMPSVLAEIGFLTNSADESLLRKPEHREKIAEALFKGISNYAESLSHFQVAKNAAGQ